MLRNLNDKKQFHIMYVNSTLISTNLSTDARTNFPPRGLIDSFIMFRLKTIFLFSYAMQSYKLQISKEKKLWR